MSEGLNLELSELTGEYGPIHINETLIQKIWLSGDFSRDKLRTTLGEEIELIHRGIWNKLEGPDFKNAQIRINGKDLKGDIEIHFKEGDWFAHGHQYNPEYKRVILHVVLFPDKIKLLKPKVYIEKKAIPVLVLLPLLHQDLESYLHDEIYHDKSDGILARLFRDLKYEDKTQLLPNFIEKARFRWQAKCARMQERISRKGAEEALHISVLQSLGSRRNQAIMTEIAEIYPFHKRAKTFTSLEAYELMDKRWKHCGSRPANHPKLRLYQYETLCIRNPKWNENIIKYDFTTSTVPETNTSLFRKKLKMGIVHNEIMDSVFAGVFSSSRFNTLMADVILPFKAVLNRSDLFDYWWHWYCGDIPDYFKKHLKKLIISDKISAPFSNGKTQALLQLFYESGGKFVE